MKPWVLEYKTEIYLPALWYLNVYMMAVTNHCGSFNRCGTEKVVR